MCEQGEGIQVGHWIFYKRTLMLWNWIQLPQGNPIGKITSNLWYVETASSLINNTNMSLDSYLVMRLEDLILEPENTIKTLLQFFSMPIPPLAQHYVLQVTCSNQFKLSTGERISQQSMELWQDYISSNQIRTIEEICEPVMDMVGYELVR